MRKGEFVRENESLSADVTIVFFPFADITDGLFPFADIMIGLFLFIFADVTIGLVSLLSTNFERNLQYLGWLL
jgi:uncharacterized membrane protein